MTLRVSHGTKFFGLKNFSYDVVLILFYEIFLVVCQNLKFCHENMLFCPYFYVMVKKGKKLMIL